jgi:hypothetical protein
MYLLLTKFKTTLVVFRNDSSKQIPKFPGMIEVHKVAELMHNHIIHELRCQEGNAVIKIEITLL